MVVGPHDVALLREAARQTVQEYTKFRAARATGTAQ
jgi:hypothetical protein